MNSFALTSAVLLSLSLASCSNGGSGGAGSPGTSNVGTSAAINGSAFGDSFVAGYSYARLNKGEFFIVIGNGKMESCDKFSSDETAYIGLGVAAQAGSYAGPQSASYATASIQPRDFTGGTVTVSTVTPSKVSGRIDLVSPDGGKVAGSFDAIVCP